MNLKKLYKKYQDHHWIEEEAMISLHLMDPWSTCYVQPSKVFPKDKVYSFVFFLEEKDHLYEWSSREDSLRILKWMRKTYHQNSKFWKNKDKEHSLVFDEIKELFYFFRDNQINHFTDKELWWQYNNLLDTGTKSFAFNLLTEALDAIEDEDYVKALDKVPADKVSEVIGVLSSPDYISFIEREHLALLVIAKKYFYKTKIKKFILKENLKSLQKEADFYNDLLAHQNDFFWMQNNYKQAHHISLEYFLHSLAEIYRNKKLAEINGEIKFGQQKHKDLEKERQRVYKKYRVSKEAKDFFALIRLMATWQDKRKESVQRIISAVDKILDVIASRKKVSKIILRSYFVEDIGNILLKNKKLTKSKLKSRENTLFYTYVDKHGQVKKDIFYGQQAVNCKKYFQRHLADHRNNENLSGFVASQGKLGDKVEGVVNIVHNPHKDKFKKGSILVTGMTRPEFVPYMRQAKAIITNEGGITTHAAIISRELKIPCIIGTKVATDLLKNGDSVQLDMRKGIIIKK